MSTKGSSWRNTMINYFLFYTAIAIIFALFEIQIEGKSGWAEKLPTWRVYKSWFRYLPGANKPLTGYHFYLWIMIFLFIHTSYVFLPFSFKNELIILSGYIYILRLEDFLWFIFNPHFGLKNFKKGKIPWHTDWLYFLPTQYYYSALLWGVLLYFGLN